MEGLISLYLVVGLILGMERLSRVNALDNTSMVCIGIISIVVFWPLYVIYKVIQYL